MLPAQRAGQVLQHLLARGDLVCGTDIERIRYRCRYRNVRRSMVEHAQDGLGVGGGGPRGVAGQRSSRCRGNARCSGWRRR
jgi:hypothetical protein